MGRATAPLEPNHTSSPSAMRPASGWSRPAIAASVVDLPAPDGPKRIVIPGGARNETSSEKSRPPARWTRSVTSSSAIALPRKLVDEVERADRDAGEDHHH